jgi:hypothetical protein
MSTTEVMHRYDLNDWFGQARHDGRPNVHHHSPAHADPLLERLRAVHGCPRYDLPRELMQAFDLRRFAREYLYKAW